MAACGNAFSNIAPSCMSRLVLALRSFARSRICACSNRCRSCINLFCSSNIRKFLRDIKIRVFDSIVICAFEGVIAKAVDLLSSSRHSKRRPAFVHKSPLAYYSLFLLAAFRIRCPLICASYRHSSQQYFTSDRVVVNSLPQVSHTISRLRSFAASCR